ncbi:MAG: PTS sugar transporter subunit IIB [Candidatus Izemoplasmataceae bacterium]
MKILAVCGFGVGSSMVLKMTIDKVVRKLGIDAEVENADISTAKSSKCDAIFTSYDLAESLKDTVNVPVLPVKRYMSIEEVTEQIKKII